ncbi:hypothetical protein [Deinococcus sp.]|uniref:hypothetical protein n=1 Tax=Deinococcus sp. TaxID=47478 RepID=UPI003CC572F3
MGVWKQYQDNPAFALAGNMGYIRFSPDGSFVLADTLEHADAPHAPFPFGRVSFENSRLVFSVQGVPPGMPECARAVYEVRVLRLGSRPVGMQYTLVEDLCKPRLAALNHVLPYARAVPESARSAKLGRVLRLGRSSEVQGRT